MTIFDNYWDVFTMLEIFEKKFFEQTDYSRRQYHIP